jgi:hypothetical protein
MDIYSEKNTFSTQWFAINKFSLSALLDVGALVIHIA